MTSWEILMPISLERLTHTQWPNKKERGANMQQETELHCDTCDTLRRRGSETIWIIWYIADNTSSSSLSLVPLILSDNIPARSSLRSSPASFQSASRLYYWLRHLLAPLVHYLSRESIQLCLIRNKNDIIKLHTIFILIDWTIFDLQNFTKTLLANFLILLFLAYLSEHSWQSFPSI